MPAQLEEYEDGSFQVRVVKELSKYAFMLFIVGTLVLEYQFPTPSSGLVFSTELAEVVTAPSKISLSPNVANFVISEDCVVPNESIPAQNTTSISAGAV